MEEGRNPSRRVVGKGAREEWRAQKRHREVEAGRADEERRAREESGHDEEEARHSEESGGGRGEESGCRGEDERREMEPKWIWLRGGEEETLTNGPGGHGARVRDPNFGSDGACVQ